MKPIRTLLALLPLLAIGGCDSEPKVSKEPASEVAEVVGPIVSEEVLAGWGYRTVSSGSRRQPDWEAGAFGGAKVRAQAIKALKEVPGWDGAFYRFTLVEETFADRPAAESRFERLKESDPGLDTKQHPELILRDGFTAGGKVFYVTTDVAKFEMEKMPEVVAALRAHVLGKGEGEAVKGSSR